MTPVIITTHAELAATARERMDLTPDGIQGGTTINRITSGIRPRRV